MIIEEEGGIIFFSFEISILSKIFFLFILAHDIVLISSLALEYFIPWKFRDLMEYFSPLLFRNHLLY